VTRNHRKARAAACVAALAGATVAGCGDDANEVDEQSGPMQLTSHHVGSMLYPLGEPAFITVPACGTDGPFDARIVSVSARKVTGADDVDFQAAWLGPG
jgi:hypothetical protein